MKIKNILVIVVCLAIAFALAGLSYFITEKSEIDACETVKTYHGWPFIYRIDVEVLQQVCYGIGIKTKNNPALYADALLFFVIIYSISFLLLRKKFNLKTGFFVVVLIVSLGLGIYFYTTYWDWIEHIK